SGGLTKDNTLALSGAVSDAGVVASVLVYDGATLLGAATISGGNWGFTTGALTDGLHSFTAKAIDNVGNSFTTAAINATVDTVAPTAGTLSFTGLTDTGSSQSPAITQDGTFDLSLSGNADLNGTSVAYEVSTRSSTSLNSTHVTKTSPA